MHSRILRKTSIVLMLAAALATSTAFAQKEESQPEESQSELEAKLKAAQERLNQAAQEIGELTVKLGYPFVQHFDLTTDGRRRAIIGVQLDPESPREGARVDEVSPGGPAATAGIREGDVIVSVNGKSVAGDRPVREVTRLLRNVEPDSKVKVRVKRGDKMLDFDVVARAAPRREFSIRVPEMPRMEHFREFEYGFPEFGWRGALSGMELATLTPQLGKYFGTEEGVLVVRAPESDALKLEDGDVILSIDGRKPTSGSHATRILRSYQPGEQIKMRIMRQRKSMDLTVTLPERPRDRGNREQREQRSEQRSEQQTESA